MPGKAQGEDFQRMRLQAAKTSGIGNFLWRTLGNPVSLPLHKSKGPSLGPDIPGSVMVTDWLISGLGGRY
jgi:hypothetical protein